MYAFYHEARQIVLLTYRQFYVKSIGVTYVVVKHNKRLTQLASCQWKTITMKG
jgi:hypothetical protein